MTQPSVNLVKPFQKLWPNALRRLFALMTVVAACSATAQTVSELRDIGLRLRPIAAPR